jgi:hypothetical protein
MMLMEGPLQRMQRFAICQTFDGLDFLSIGLDSKEEARAYGPTVQEHGAGTANTVLTADVGPGKPQIVA